MCACCACYDPIGGAKTPPMITLRMIMASLGLSVDAGLSMMKHFLVTSRIVFGVE